MKFHFDNRPRRPSDPRMVIVYLLFAVLVFVVACFSLVMSVCCR